MGNTKDISHRVNTSIEYLNLVYQQNIQQKETRDKWFRYYLLLIVTPMGLIATVSQTKILSEDTQTFYLFIALTGIFFFVLGFIFLTIYIKQRQNYVKSNQLIRTIEEKIILPYIWNQDKLVKKYKSSNKSKRTADYFANLVYIFLNSVWASIIHFSYSLYSDFPTVDTKLITIGVALVFVIAFMLQILYRHFLLKEDL